MNATYLRIKNWGELQHYSDRRPPWIKVYPRLLEDDAFARLEEIVQWQLVRIWFVASRSTAITLDEGGREVPAVANDPLSLQRSIQSLKKVPLERLIREGWLIPVSEDELVSPTAHPKRRRSASTNASAVASTAASKTGDGGASASLRGRDSEGSEVLDQISGRHFKTEGLPETIDAESTLLAAKLMQSIGDHADQHTPDVVSKFAAQLPPASLAKVAESLSMNRPRNRAAYAVAALRKELEERNAA